MGLSDKLGAGVDRVLGRITGDDGPVGPPAAEEPSEQDVGQDPRVASSRAAGGDPDEVGGDAVSSTGTGDTDVFVGRTAGRDLGYAGETGAEARREAGEGHDSGHDSGHAEAATSDDDGPADHRRTID